MKMRYLVLSFVLFASPALAQSSMTGPIPATARFQWEMPETVLSVADARTFEARISENGTPLTALTGFTCVPPVAPSVRITCEAPVSASNRDALNRPGVHPLTIKMFRADIDESPASPVFTLRSPLSAPPVFRILP